MSKLGTNPSPQTVDLSDTQKDYISTFGEEKFQSLAQRWKNDENWLQKKIGEGNSGEAEKSSEGVTVAGYADQVTHSVTQGQEGAITLTQDQFSELMGRMSSLEKQVKENSEKDKFDKGTDIYDGPRFYSYKIWTGMPVLGFQSKLRDESYGLTYVNQRTGALVNNQVLRLALFNQGSGKTEYKEVDAIVFNNNFERSEKLPATEQKNDAGKVVGYTFTVNGKQFTVLESCIN